LCLIKIKKQEEVNDGRDQRSKSQKMFEALMDMLTSKMANYKPFLTMFFEKLLNYLMLKEREKFLAKNRDNKANSFYKRPWPCLLLN